MQHHGIVYLYHGAPTCIRDSIRERGILAGLDGVYASSDLNSAATFVASRAMTHFAPATQEQMREVHRRVAAGDASAMAEHFHNHDSFDVWEFEAHTSEWEEGDDHDPAFFRNASSLRSDKAVPAAKLTSVTNVRYCEEQGAWEATAYVLDEGEWPEDDD